MLRLSRTTQHTVAATLRKKKVGVNYPLSYELAMRNDQIGIQKGGLSLNANGLHGQPDTHQPVIEDQFIRHFLLGTFYRMIERDIVIKRRANFIDISVWAYEYRPLKDPNLMITRGQKPMTRQRWVQVGDRKARELLFMKGYRLRKNILNHRIYKL